MRHRAIVDCDIYRRRLRRCIWMYYGSRAGLPDVPSPHREQRMHPWTTGGLHGRTLSRVPLRQCRRRQGPPTRQTNSPGSVVSADGARLQKLPAEEALRLLRKREGAAQFLDPSERAALIKAMQAS